MAQKFENIAGEGIDTSFGELKEERKRREAALHGEVDLER